MAEIRGLLQWGRASQAAANQLLTSSRRRASRAQELVGTLGYLPPWNPGNHFTFAKSSANVTRNRSAEVAFLCMSIFTSFLEPEVLESFGSAAIELRGHTVVAEPRREVALGDPDRGLVAG